MSLKLCALASGSSGNCTYISDGSTSLLVDAGISPREIAKRMLLSGIDISGVQAILSTHCHTDHCKGMASFVKSTDVPVYVHAEGAHALSCQTGLPAGSFLTFLGEDFSVGSLIVSPIKLMHDAPHCSGFVVAGGGVRVAVITDLGRADTNVIDAAKGCAVVMLESNHDEELLQNGVYPYRLKRRIMSASGHLSNSACAEVCANLRGAGTQQFVLAHLSRENNVPELAYSSFVSHMSEQGYSLGGDYSVEISYQHKPTKIFCAE